MRVKFRDYFTYAIQGYVSDPIDASQCTADCLLNSDMCCLSVTAVDTTNGFTANDNLCMHSKIANSLSDITLDTTTYHMSCSITK